jgi:hypothetical protein
VSPNFLASDFIAKQELPALLNAAEKEGLVILWIYISPCLYDEAKIEPYQAANEISKPLDGLTPSQQNAVLVNVCRKIKLRMAPIPPVPMIWPQKKSTSRARAATKASIQKAVAGSTMEEPRPHQRLVGTQIRRIVFCGQCQDGLLSRFSWLSSLGYYHCGPSRNRIGQAMSTYWNFSGPYLSIPTTSY